MAIHTLHAQRSQNIKLGLFVVVATLLLSGAVFILGQRQTLFGKTFGLNAVFEDVKGLQQGNDVRYMGINVGTVKRIVFLPDSRVRVDLAIRKETQEFIKRDVYASIGTDGLLGNRVVNLIGRGSTQVPVEVNQTLPAAAKDPVEVVLQKALHTGDELSDFLGDARYLVRDIRKGKGTVGTLLQDSLLARELFGGVQQLHLTFRRTAIASGELTSLLKDIRAGRGLIGKLVSDSALGEKLDQAVSQLEISAVHIQQATGALEKMTRNTQGGAVHTLLADTVFAQNLSVSMEQIRKGTEGFAQHMEALKDNILFRRYYKKRKKQLTDPTGRQESTAKTTLSRRTP